MGEFVTGETRGSDDSRFVEEGKSRLTPFEAQYLLYLALELRVGTPDGHDSKRVSYHARVEFLKELIELERQHPDWHFDDFELYIRREIG